jgi:hypothetical protein
MKRRMGFLLLFFVGFDRAWALPTSPASKCRIFDLQPIATATARLGAAQAL